MGVVRRGLALWWHQLFAYSIFNILWVTALFTVVGAPPATAALYQMAHNSVERDYVGYRPFFHAILQHFIPAWKWALLQIVVYGVIGFNLINYAYASGELWVVLRICWILGALGWTLLNVFYWSFYFREYDQRMVNTYRNTLIFCLHEPLLVVSLLLWTVLVVVLSISTGFLLAFAMMPLLIFPTTIAVYETVKVKNVTATN